jgi:hypothetical protein
MSDTLGSLCDKISIVNNKLFNYQQDLYRIRKMTEEQFLNEFSTQEKLKELFKVFQSATDLNFQRSSLSNEIDLKVIEMIEAAMKGEDLDQPKFLSRARKTY